MLARVKAADCDKDRRAAATPEQLQTGKSGVAISQRICLALSLARLLISPWPGLVPLTPVGVIDFGAEPLKRSNNMLAFPDLDSD
jgi:hypothetical protein